MTQYAQVNNSGSQPWPIIGFYDTAVYDYPNLPPASELFEMTATQWAQTRANPSGWAVENNEIIAYNPITPPTLSQLAQQLLLVGQLQIESTSYPTLNATYSIDSNTITFINSEMICLMYFNTFTNGQTVIAWPDITGASHNISLTEFPLFGKGIAAWYNTVLSIAQTNSGTLPNIPFQIG